MSDLIADWMNQWNDEKETQGNGGTDHAAKAPALVFEQHPAENIQQEEENPLPFGPAYPGKERDPKKARGKIRNALIKGKNPFEVIRTAAREIAKATGDKDFYNDVLDQIETVYGVGLGDVVPLKVVREVCSRRLQLLKSRLKGKYGTGQKNVIGNAIRAQERELARIDREISEAHENGCKERVDAIRAMEKVVQLWKDEIEDAEKEPYESIAQRVDSEREKEAAEKKADKGKQKELENDEYITDDGRQQEII